MKPLVSICIPAYNSAAFIRSTIESALAQTYDNLEVVVIDDCSRDNTVEIVSAIQDSRLRLVRNETNLGMTGNWNKCIEEARGEFVKLLCADDILYPNSIAFEAQALLSCPSVVLAVSDTRLIDIEGNITGAYKRWFKKGRMDGKKLAKICLMLNNFNGAPCNCLFRREAALKAGGFDPSFTYILDFDLWIALCCIGEVYIIHRYLNAFRIRRDSNTGDLIGNRQEVYVEEHRKLVEKYARSGLIPLSPLECRLSVLIRRLRNVGISLYLKLFMK